MNWDADVARSELCDFCQHRYLMPCTDSEQENCPNMVWLRSRGKASSQQSYRHHYIPKFYSKRWGDKDFKITEYSRPYNSLQCRRVYPVQTGFAYRLYERKGVPSSSAQTIEDEFMKPVDDRAAKSLDLLEAGDSRIHADAELRSAWSHFLLTLLMRTPKDIEVLKEIVADDWARDFPMFEKKYLDGRKVGDPETLQKFIDQKDPGYLARWAIENAYALMNYEVMVQLINNMHWFVITMGAELPLLLTSDRPVVMSDSLIAEDSYLYIPLGPNRLFVAVTNAGAEDRIKRFPSVELIEDTNKLLVLQASRYVYGANDKAREFVEQHFGKPGPRSLMERLRDVRRDRGKGGGDTNKNPGR